MLVGTCVVLGWEAFQGEYSPPEFRVDVLETLPIRDQHLLRFRITNEGANTAEEIAVTGRLGGEPPETARIVLDFLAPGEEREGGLLFSRDPRTQPLTLGAESYADP
jgi:uncharacterized protein (TIGR02588 family)